MPINEKREAIGRHAPADWWSQQFGDRGAAQLLFGNDPAMASAVVAEVFRVWPA